MCQFLLSGLLTSLIHSTNRALFGFDSISVSLVCSLQDVPRKIDITSKDWIFRCEGFGNQPPGV